MPRTGSDGGYPWSDGELLYAADLNAAIAGASASGGGGGGSVSVLDYGAKGDGTTDDTAALQTVLNNNAGKAVVFVPDTGHSYITNTLIIPSGTDLLIDGSMLLKAGATSHLLYVNGANNVTIRGHGTLNGNNPANSYPAASGGTLFILSSTNVQVSGLTIQNAPLWNLVAQQSSHILFTGITITGGRNASGFSVLCDNCWLMNSAINGPDNDIGFSFYSGITNSGAIGNTVKNSGMATSVSGAGINVLADNVQGGACTNIIIANNIVTGVGGSGIQVFSSVAAEHQDITITGNRCFGNGQRPNGNRGDFDINQVNNVVITGNTSANFGSNTDPWWGIYLGARAGGATVSGNLIYGTGKGGSAGIGINLASPSAASISDNTIYDTVSTPTMQYAISGTAGTACSVVDNFCGRPFNLTMNTDTVSRNIRNQATQYDVDTNAQAPIWINGPAGTNRMPVFTTSGVARWYFGLDNTAEGGSSAGSNFQILSCNDAGAAVRTPLSINRQTGITTLAVAPVYANLPGNYANDAAAATGGVPVGGVYRNGSALQVRVS